MALGILVLVVFLAGAGLMIARVVPAVLVLPVMGIAIAAGAATLDATMDWHDVLDGVVSQGAFSLHKAMIVTLIGGALSFVMQRAGVAEHLVKQGAELVPCSDRIRSLFAPWLRHS